MKFIKTYQCSGYRLINNTQYIVFLMDLPTDHYISDEGMTNITRTYTHSYTVLFKTNRLQVWTGIYHVPVFCSSGIIPL